MSRRGIIGLDLYRSQAMSKNDNKSPTHEATSCIRKNLGDTGAHHRQPRIAAQAHLAQAGR